MTELYNLSALPPGKLACYTDAADVPQGAVGWVYVHPTPYKNGVYGSLYFVPLTQYSSGGMMGDVEGTG